MAKKSLDQNKSFKELYNSIEPNFIFSKKPINRIKVKKNHNDRKNLNKITLINELKKLIN